MFDWGPKVKDIDFVHGNKFEWRSGTTLTIFSRDPDRPNTGLRVQLRELKLINYTMQGWGLSYNGRELAKTFPVVHDPFDKKRKRR